MICARLISKLFQSTRPSRSATAHYARCRKLIDISIHAPLAERDKGVVVYNQKEGNFNPRAPRGARQEAMKAPTAGEEFQSTRPSRSATVGRFSQAAPTVISIHAPLAERDSKCAQKSRTYLR